MANSVRQKIYPISDKALLLHLFDHVRDLFNFVRETLIFPFLDANTYQVS